MTPIAPTKDDAYRPLDGRAILRRHGKSFFFAGKFLNPKQLSDSARLYAFCRHLDDIADDSACPEQAGKVLGRIHDDVSVGESREPIVEDFIHLAQSHAIDRRIALALIDGLRGDLEQVLVPDSAHLLRYCYRAAGTVGLLMSRLLGADRPAARFHAIDLGVAMQLTNIARDVAEDARNGRRYLPAHLLPGVSLAEIAKPGETTRPLLQAAVHTILSTADRYYASGEAGLACLPSRPHLAILIASRIYRAIGTELRRRHCATWEGRAFVSGPQKALIAAQTIAEFALRRGWSAYRGNHEAHLHEALTGLPETHCEGFPA